MKRYLATALSLIMMLSLFAGCGISDLSLVSGTGTGDVRTDIIIGTTSDVVSPDPHKQNDTASGKVLHMLYDTLIVMNGDGEFEPCLAESWENTSDTEYVFHLREGVKFHNGTEMKASDVKFSIERCMQSAKTAQATDSVDYVEVIDDYTVKIVTKYPFAPFYSTVASSTKVSILPEEYVKECDAKSETAFQEAPVGTGPMMYDSWAPNNYFKVVRNDNYWAGEPVTTSVTIRVIPEATSLTIALETGEVDIVESIQAVDIRRVKDNPDLKWLEQVQGSVTYLGMNYAKEPYNNTNLRKAIAYGINRQSIIDVILEGNGQILNSVFPPMMPGYDDSIEGYDYDIEKAKHYMAEAGYPDGGLSLEIATSGDERNRIAQLIQSDLSKVGIDISIELLEWGAYLEYVGGTDHEMFILGWSNAYEPDGNMFDTFHKDRPSTTNRSNFRNDEISAKIEKARQELDWTKREKMYKELQQLIMAEPVWIPLFAKTAVIGMNRGLEGVEFEPITQFTYVNAYVNE
ncbi:MAG: ABC transporter substrate-binding protein [Clostridia bacterium]|nr:ABC transporter substrate-binding protein [Clostridia bacterium]